MSCRSLCVFVCFPPREMTISRCVCIVKVLLLVGLAEGCYKQNCLDIDREKTRIGKPHNQRVTRGKETSSERV